MANVVNRITKEYLTSVNTPQYEDPQWLINPDTSLVINEVDQIPTIFWIVPQIGDPSIIITADRVAWKRSLKQSDIETYRDNQLAGFFHYAPNGNDLTEGDLYDASSFNTAILVDKVLAIVSGVPEDAITESGTFSVSNTTGYIMNLTSAELMNFHARYQRTREIVRQDYYAKRDELDSLTTVEEIDEYDPYSNWRPI